MEEALLLKYPWEACGGLQAFVKSLHPARVILKIKPAGLALMFYNGAKVEQVPKFAL